MDILRTALTVALGVIIFTPAAGATPIDATWDILHAVERGDGDSFMEMLSNSVRSQIEAAYAQLQEIARQNPQLAEELLRRTGAGIAPSDLEWMTLENFVSGLLGSVQLPSLDEVVSESTSMSGRNAQVVFTWDTGFSMTFQLTWEDSAWRVTGSPVLERLF